MVDKRQMLCLVLGIIAAVSGFFVDNTDGELTDGRKLERGFYGEGERKKEIWVSGLSEKETRIEMELGDRNFDAAAAERSFEAAAGRLGEMLPGENLSLKEVRKNLLMPVWLEEYGISVSWESENPQVIGTDGTVFGEDCPEEGEEIIVKAEMMAGEYTRELSWSIMVFPPDYTEDEKRRQEFRQLLCRMDEEQQTSEQFVLPDEYEGRKLSYRVRRGREYLIFPVLGAAAAVLIPFRDRQKEKERKRERERRMMLDYPQIVSKLAVFYGAGLPVRRAWEKIVRDYEEKGGKCEAYAEMARTYHMMERGTPELQAYAEFGNRCHCRAYRKLAGILEQNVRNGSGELRKALETELESAFEEQKAAARKMGEEASTKLLVPLFLMLLIVMIIVTVPAFLSFGVG